MLSLHHQPDGTDGEIRTLIDLFLRQAPLRLGYVGKNWLERRDSNPRTLAPKASPYSRLRNALTKKLAPEKGFEPLFPDPKSGVLPVGRLRNLEAPVRFERTTSGLENRRSDPLSYEAAKWKGREDLNLQPARS